MQTCSICHAQTPDAALVCNNCQADLKKHSVTAITLKQLQANPRVRNVRLVVSDDCCPACHETEGTFLKERTPSLPVEGCSHPLGCRCFYEPMLSEIYP